MASARATRKRRMRRRGRRAKVAPTWSCIRRVRRPSSRQPLASTRRPPRTAAAVEIGRGVGPRAAKTRAFCPWRRRKQTGRGESPACWTATLTRRTTSTANSKATGPGNYRLTSPVWTENRWKTATSIIHLVIPRRRRRLPNDRKKVSAPTPKPSLFFTYAVKLSRMELTYLKLIFILFSSK